ncbi:hypothetical protein T01_2512 [Trichinella spiralis]|uniref:HAT C-terminal dimerisation domain-containing protein n=1 Tax=Trichinella spiralis TaxID=6334 RepID=A0A0V1BEX4_TRISP|nr:hypothetical protein T01_2512 [Trichinella spiralis]
MNSRRMEEECFCVILEAAEKLYSDLIPLPRNISRQMSRSIDPKENREYYPLRFFDKLLPHRNNAMPLIRFKPIRKFDGHLVKIYRRPKRATQCENVLLYHYPANALDALALRPNDYYPMVSLLLQIFVTQPITSANAERSSTAVKYLKSYFRTSMTEERLNRLAAMCTFILTFPLIMTLLTILLGSRGNLKLGIKSSDVSLCANKYKSNVYIHSDFSTDIDLVDHFVGLTRESEAWHKIIGRLLVRKQVQKVLIKLMIAGLAVPQLQCSHAVRQTVAVRNQGAIARCYIQSSIFNLRKPVFNATCAVSVFYANWAI